MNEHIIRTSSRPFPSGKITLVFTDIEESTRLIKAIGDESYRQILEQHHQRVRLAISSNNGHEVDTAGDGFFVVFSRAEEALAAVTAIQSSLSSPRIIKESRTLMVRIGVHTAEYELICDDTGKYHGIDVHFAARVSSLGIGGQIIVSDSTYRSTGAVNRYKWYHWGNRRLKSFDKGETVWELLWDGRSRGEPGSRWLPEWFKGELNQYVPRHELEHTILDSFVPLRPDGSVPRLVTLHGSGGIGKTRIAVACAVQAASQFPAGIFFVRLEGRTPSVMGVTEAIEEAMAVGPLNGTDGLFGILKDKELLLILDNYESVANSEVVTFIARLLHDTHALRLLVSTREPVKLVDVEQVVTIGEMTNSEGQELFLARMKLKRRLAQPLDANERAFVDELMVLTERIPLSIELAAAWTGKRSLAEITEGLRNTPLGAFAAIPPRAITSLPSERHRSLTRCLDWSFGLLSRHERDAFGILGIFADSFSAFTLSAVSEMQNAQEMLDRFEDAALIKRIGSSSRTRYTMHRATHAYAAGKLDSRPYRSTIAKRFINCYLTVLLNAKEAPAAAQTTLLEDEWRNIVHATAVAESIGEWSSVLALSHLTTFLQNKGLWSELYVMQERGLNAARATGDRREEAMALGNIGHYYVFKRQFDKAGEFFFKDLSICRQIGDKKGEAQALGNLGENEVLREKPIEAEEHLAASTALFEQLGDVDGQAKNYGNVALLYLKLKNLQRAENSCDRSIALFKLLHDRLGAAKTGLCLGHIREEQGQEKEAEFYYRRTLSVYIEYRYKSGEGLVYNYLGICLLKQGKLTEARDFCERGLQIHRLLGDMGNVANTLSMIAAAACEESAWGIAETYFKDSLSISRDLGDQSNVGATLLNMAKVRSSMGDKMAALALCDQAIASYNAAGNSDEAKRIGEWMRHVEDQDGPDAAQDISPAGLPTRVESS